MRTEKPGRQKTYFDCFDRIKNYVGGCRETSLSPNSESHHVGNLNELVMELFAHSIAGLVWNVIYPLFKAFVIARVPSGVSGHIWCETKHLC